jgi:hypothetical protein
VQLRLAPASELRLLSAERGFGRAVTVTVLVGAGLGFLVTRTFTVFVAVAVTVTVLPARGCAVELPSAPRIAPMTKMTRLRVHAPMTMACLDAGQSPLTGGDGWPVICRVS